MKNNIYESLTSVTFENDKINWSQICSTISKLSTDHTEILYSLILHYYFTETKNPSSQMKTKGKIIQLPFGGKTFDNGKGAIYQLEKLPEKLKRIIAAYILTVSTQ